MLCIYTTVIYAKCYYTVLRGLTNSKGTAVPALRTPFRQMGRKGTVNSALDTDS